MLIGLRQPLERGQRVPLTLVFARAGRREVTLRVESAGARAPQSAERGHRH
jgi:copper(I)-binding protein